MLLVSLNCPFFIAPSVFSNAWNHTVLYCRTITWNSQKRFLLGVNRIPKLISIDSSKTRYDYEVSSLPNRPLTTGLKNKSKVTSEIEQCWIFVVLWWPFWKWRPVEIFRYRESIQVIIIYLHMKFRWNRTLLKLFGIVAVILKMATARNFSVSGHHNLPTYEMSLKSDNVEFVQYCGVHFENGDR
jgi:hypothetical protein